MVQNGHGLQIRDIGCMDNTGNVRILMSDIENMTYKPNLGKDKSDFNLWRNDEPARRLEPEETITIN